MGVRTSVLLPDGSEFRIRSLGLVWNFTEVKQDGVFLDVGFSLCTVPTYCWCPGISDIGSGFGIEVRSLDERVREQG